MSAPASSRASGFTLIELSIVLVIIGLIVGGVLSGKDLIRAASIRATLSQLEAYDTAVNVFRDKYRGYPGDLASPGNFGFDDSGSSTLGNGIIDTTTNDDTQFDTEAAVFFRHLFQAEIIWGSINGAANYTTDVNNIADFVPSMRVWRSIRFIPHTDGGRNYYFLGNITVSSGTITSYNAGQELPVIDAFSLDQKLDDGYPTTGRVLAMTDLDTADTGAAAADGECVNSTPDPDAYNSSTQQRAEDTVCSLRIRASF